MIAPHPDDETLAAGGLIFDLVRAGWHVSIVVVTDGAASHPHIRDLSIIRADECRRAAVALGVTDPPRFLGFPDGETLRQVDAVSMALREFASGVDVVVGPRSDDFHSDHVATALAIDQAFSSPATHQLHYAVWGWDLLVGAELDLASARSFRPSPEALQAKQAALGSYNSQLTDVYGRVILDDSLVSRHTADTEVFWP